MGKHTWCWQNHITQILASPRCTEQPTQDMGRWEGVQLYEGRLANTAQATIAGQTLRLLSQAVYDLLRSDSHQHCLGSMAIPKASHVYSLEYRRHTDCNKFHSPKSKQKYSLEYVSSQNLCLDTIAGSGCVLITNS